MQYGYLLIMMVLMLLSGCSMWRQTPNTVLIREPDQRVYHAESDVNALAKAYWQYAMLATMAYDPNLPSVINDPAAKSESDVLGAHIDKTCEISLSKQASFPRWQVWTQFPNNELAERAYKKGLFFSVWQRNESDGSSPELAIVFRGTDKDQTQDWRSNIRWFIPSILRGEDQYTLTRKLVAQALHDEIARRRFSGTLPERVKLVSVGHSLGGGLAQQLAYALPVQPQWALSVEKVVAINSSPVTGWYDVDSGLREENAKGLVVHRVFEHGEALAYIRLPFNMLIDPRKRSVPLRDVRFALEEKKGGLKNHSASGFACRLIEAAGVTQRS